MTLLELMESSKFDFKVILLIFLLKKQFKVHKLQNIKKFTLTTHKSETREISLPTFQTMIGVTTKAHNKSGKNGNQESEGHNHNIAIKAKTWAVTKPLLPI